jgi:hypothetical protein
MRKLIPVFRRSARNGSICLLAGMLFNQCEKEVPPPSGTLQFSDQMFLEALVSEGVDANDDGYIVVSEAEATEALYIGFYKLTDLTGIEAFVNLGAGMSFTRSPA